MYKNIFITDKYSNDATVHLWTDGEDGEPEYMKFPYNSYGYVIDKSSRLNKRSLFGDRVRKVNYVSKKQKAKLREEHGKENVSFESDVRPETRVLIDRYTNSDEPSKNNRIFWFDIEVATEPDFPDPKVAQNTVTSIAYYDEPNDKQTILLLDDNLDDFTSGNATVFTFSSEVELLKQFLEDWKRSDPDIVVGYNSDRFDIPYTYRRLKKLLSHQEAKQLSPIGIVDHNPRSDIFSIAGVSSMDYFKLYKNFTFSELSSYSLDNVAKEELDKGKVEYKGLEYEVNGEIEIVESLDDLKRLDPEKFVEYNMEDVMLLVEMDDKLDFIELARKICHLGHVPYEDIYMSSRFIGGACLTYLARENIVAPDRKSYDMSFKKDHMRGVTELEVEEEIPEYIPYKGDLKVYKTKSGSTTEILPYKARKGNKFILEENAAIEVKKWMDLALHYPGAFVKDPDPGLREWIYDLDLTSEYPTIIMTLNISPETKVGRVFGWDAAEVLRGNGKEEYEVYLFDSHKRVNIETFKLLKMLKDKNLSIASNGVFYRNDKRGVIPQILENWFEDRQNNKALRDEWRAKSGPEAEKKAAYYDKMQHCLKILINSVYGVLGLSSFRFYDVDNATAVTETGRTLIKFTETMGNKFYNDALGTEDVDYCVYVDTDSVTGDALFHSKEHGVMPISDIFDKVERGSETKRMASEGREFVFPNDLTSYVTRHGRKADKSKVDYIEKHKTNKEIFKITASTGEKVRVTEDHSVMVKSGYRLIEKKPSELEVGDKIIRLVETSDG